MVRFVLCCTNRLGNLVGLRFVGTPEWGLFASSGLVGSYECAWLYCYVGITVRAPGGGCNMLAPLRASVCGLVVLR